MIRIPKSVYERLEREWRVTDPQRPFREIDSGLAFACKEDGDQETRAPRLKVGRVD